MAKHDKGGIKALLVLREVAIVVVVAVIISALVKAFLLQAFRIPSYSMWETLDRQDRVVASKLVPHVRSINRGDIVVFKDPHNWLGEKPVPPPTSVGDYLHRGAIMLGLRPDDVNFYLIKRVIGVGGDRVQCCDAKGRLMVNGTSIDEPYLRPDVAPSEMGFDVTVPRGKLWVMGDNRSNSADSRYHMNGPTHGFVPVKNVVGRAFIIIWPVSHWTLLSNGDAFAKVPRPR